MQKRWSLLWHGFFYVQLVAASGLSIYLEALPLRETGFLLVLSLLFGLYYSIFIAVRISYWRCHPLIAQGYLVISWALWFVLASRYPFYWYMLFGLCSQVYFLSTRFWKIPGILLLTLLSLWRIITSAQANNVMLLIFLGWIFIGLLVAFQIEEVNRQNQEKDRLLRELEATRKELAAVERQAGAAQERQRLAHEIHDTLAQGFTSIMMHGEAAESILHEDKEGVKRHLDQIRCTARENLSEARRLMWALQPEVLERASLPDVLAHYTKKWSEENRVVASTTVTGSPCLLRPEIEVTILRAAQEALANVWKHAQARQVRVTLSYMDDMVVLDVQDDGIGFEPLQTVPQAVLTVSQNVLLPITLKEHTTGGFGLKALRERAEQSGGQLLIESATGEGTTLTLSLPALVVHSSCIAQEQ